ncbi:MAG: sensor histidine kinase [Candidatus Omnitrophota bacterium]
MTKKAVSGGLNTRVYYLFIFITFIFFLLTGVVVFARTKAIIKNFIFNELGYFIQNVDARIDLFIEAKKGRALDFCSDGIIKDGLTYYDPDDKDVDKLRQQIDDHLAKNKVVLDAQLEDTLILNLKGKVIFSNNERNIGKDKSREEYFRQISRYFKDQAVLKKLRRNPTSTVYAGDVYVSEDLNAPALAVSNIITARATGLPLGVLVNRYRLDVLIKSIEIREAAMGNTGKFYLINKDGLLLNIPKFFPSGKKEDIILKERIDIPVAITILEDSVKMLGVYRDFRAEPVLGAAMLMKRNNWLIIAEKDTREAFAPLYSLTWQMIFIGLAALVVIVGVFLFIIRLHKKVDEKNRELEDSRNKMFQSGKLAAVGQLASSVAHEINNPLTGVLNNVQLIKMEMEMGADFKVTDFKEQLDVIEESASRCVKIARSLLDFSRAAKGTFQPFSLNEAVEKTITLIGHELKLRDVSVKKELGENLPRIQGDTQLIQQVIFDIVNNARYAIEKNPKKEAGLIILKTRYDMVKDLVLLSISDNGTGISPENLDKLFTPFFTTKPVGEGTGLGLSFIQDIVKRHNGKVSVESELGKGTTFHISFPVIKENK